MDDLSTNRGAALDSHLRNAAAARLGYAARSRDPQESDQLTREALTLLDQARAAASHRAERSVWPDHAFSLRSKGESSTMSRKLVAEFFGTFWLVLGGCGSAVLAAKFPQVGIGLVGVSLAFGLTLLTMAYAIGPISGCHINPAVTLGLVAGGRFRAAEAPGYIIAQVLGGIIGALVLYGIASGAPDFSLAGGFASNGYGEHSPGHYGFWACVLCEVVMTFFFLLIILAATSERAPLGFAPIPIGLGLTLIHLISIPVTNTSVNPARSTGVAIFEGGWALSQLWLFWVAPIVGAVLAGAVYTWLGAEDSAADRDAAARQAAREPGEPLAPRTAREPR